MRWIPKIDEPGSMKKRILVLYVGGTIGMAPADRADPKSPLIPQSLDRLLTYLPALDDLLPHVQLDFETWAAPIDSAHVVPKDWWMMAQQIAKHYADYAGFVILHGTDTLAYTASALAFLLEGLAKPVVITGSQRPMSRSGSDGSKNFVDALRVAADTRCWPEVLVVFGGQLLRGCRTRKHSSMADAAFDSPNQSPLGEVTAHKVSWYDKPSVRVAHTLSIPPVTTVDIRDFSITPLATAAQLAAYVAGDCDAVLLRLYGAGTAPQSADWQAVFQSLQARGIPVFAVTQCWHGAVNLNTYAAGQGLARYGVVGLGDMTPEAALTKLYWILGMNVGDQITQQMRVSQRGE